MFQIIAAASSPAPGPPNSLAGLFVLIVIAAAVSGLLGKGTRQRRKKKPAEEQTLKSLHFEAEEPPLAYQVRPSLLTKAERSFYGVLRQVIGDRWTIFAKVRLSDIMTVPRGVNGWQTQFNKVQSKHVDMVLCEPLTLRVVAAVELDGASHERLEGQERDAFKDAVFACAKLPLIRVPARHAYSLESVRSLLAPHLKPTEMRPREIKPEELSDFERYGGGSRAFH